MRSLSFLLLALFSLGLGPSIGSAQVHAGVALSAALPDDLVALEVRAPDEVGLPTRIRVGRVGSLEAVALLDVWVLPGEEAARAVLEAQLTTRASRALLVREHLADRAHAEVATGPATLVLARRDNIVFGVRSIDPQADAAAIAESVDAAIVLAPTGSVSPAARPQETTEERTLTVAMASGLLDIAVRMTGAGSPRRTESGWLVSDLGADAVWIFWTDDHLRVGHALRAP